MGKRILIIDDSQQDRKVMSRFLNNAGYSDILSVETGDEGLKMLKEKKPDLVILDTMLLGENGFEICRRIREAFGAETPKIIITTGSVYAVDALEAKRAGADDYCAKTSDCSPLIEAVKKLV